ncbi:MAG: isoprenylcysteine carboxylmethyltransferase family protein [Anaerolineales bacterium]
MSASEETAGIPIPPPAIPFGVFTAGALVHWVASIRRWPSDGTPWLGWVLIAMCFILAAAAVAALARAGTPVDPDHPVRALVVSGPYQYVRNPIYAAFCLLYLGLAWVLGFWVCLVLFPLVPIGLMRIVIRREETYLGNRFGKEYEDYRSKVRRWGIL